MFHGFKISRAKTQSHLRTSIYPDHNVGPSAGTREEVFVRTCLVRQLPVHHLSWTEASRSTIFIDSHLRHLRLFLQAPIKHQIQLLEMLKQSRSGVCFSHSLGNRRRLQLKLMRCWYLHQLRKVSRLSWAGFRSTNCLLLYLRLFNQQLEGPFRR